MVSKVQGSKDPKRKNATKKETKKTPRGGYCFWPAKGESVSGPWTRTKKHMFLQECAKALSKLPPRKAVIRNSQCTHSKAVSAKGGLRCWLGQLDVFKCFNCLAQTSLFPYCTECCSSEGFEIRASKIPEAEWGLFTTRAFKPGEVILPYIGHTLSEEQLSERYGASLVHPYVWKSTDSALRRPWAAMANTAQRQSSNNLTIKKYPVINAHNVVTCPGVKECPGGCKGCIHYLTNKDKIRKDTELYWDYGADYLKVLESSQQPSFNTSPPLHGRHTKRFSKSKFTYCTEPQKQKP